MSTRTSPNAYKLHDKNWEEFNKMIDDVFAGKKITIKKFNK